MLPLNFQWVPLKSSLVTLFKSRDDKTLDMFTGFDQIVSQEFHNLYFSALYAITTSSSELKIGINFEFSPNKLLCSHCHSVDSIEGLAMLMSWTFYQERLEGKGLQG